MSPDRIVRKQHPSFGELDFLVRTPLAIGLEIFKQVRNRHNRLSWGRALVDHMEDFDAMNIRNS